jgi:hypothetical protein
LNLKWRLLDVLRASLDVVISRNFNPHHQLSFLKTMPLPDWSIFTSHKSQLVLAAIVSGGITASIILGAQQIRRETRVRRLKESVEEITNHDVGQLTEYGAANLPLFTKEDERNAQLALRARLGDYDEGE